MYIATYQLNVWRLVKDEHEWHIHYTYNVVTCRENCFLLSNLRKPLERQIWGFILRNLCRSTSTTVKVILNKLWNESNKVSIKNLQMFWLHPLVYGNCPKLHQIWTIQGKNSKTFPLLYMFPGSTLNFSC